VLEERIEALEPKPETTNSPETITLELSQAEIGMLEMAVGNMKHRYRSFDRDMYGQFMAWSALEQLLYDKRSYQE
jgi:hypothetical protein